MEIKRRRTHSIFDFRFELRLGEAGSFVGGAVGGGEIGDKDLAVSEVKLSVSLRHYASGGIV